MVPELNGRTHWGEALTSFTPTPVSELLTFPSGSVTGTCSVRIKSTGFTAWRLGVVLLPTRDIPYNTALGSCTSLISVYECMIEQWPVSFRYAMLCCVIQYQQFSHDFPQPFTLTPSLFQSAAPKREKKTSLIFVLRVAEQYWRKSSRAQNARSVWGSFSALPLQ
jgi:hypothetical protein